jgi:glycosyltransferase involved in cell wall biosynthesis
LPEKGVYYLPNFVDIYEYRSALENHQTKVKVEGTLSVLYVGYLGKAKGIFDLIDAVNLVRTRGIDMVFELVGSELTPGEVELIQAKIKSFQLSDLIRLNKPAYDKDKVAYFRNADIFIYPSHHEGIPMAVLEAMASGLPVIATRVGGLPDLIKENGILVDAEQPEQLADALCHLAENPNLRKEMQAKSYQIVNEKFNIERHIADLVNIYTKVSSSTHTA